MPPSTRIKPRRGTAAQWIAVNPVLQEGEIGVETDTGRMLFGDGSSAWTSLTRGLVPLSQKAAANGVATLDAGGKIPTGQLPNLAIGDVFTVASEAAMLALDAQKGDIAVRTDLNPDGVFWLGTNDPTIAANWIRIGAIDLTTDGPTATPSLRTLGHGANQAFPGDANPADRIPTGTYVDSDGTGELPDAAVTGDKLAETITDTTRKINFDFEYFRARGEKVHVVSKGADRTGVADSRNALNNAQLALPSSGVFTGGEVQLGIGAYKLDSAVPQTRSKMRWKGDHMDATVIRAGGAITRLFTTSGQAEQLEFEDLTLDGADLLNELVLLTGVLNRKVRFRRVRFTGLANPALGTGTAAVNYSRFQGLEYLDCEWDGQGKGDGRASLLTAGGKGFKAIGPRFRYLYDGFVFDTGSATSHEEAAMSDVHIEGIDSDFGWFLLLHQFAGEGSTVSYANPAGNQIVLTDTAAAFSGISTSPETNIRILPILATGAISNTTAEQVQVVGSGFTVAGVRRGDIIRCGSAIAVVLGRFSDTIVQHEGWLSEADRSPVTCPAVGTPYTIYRLWLGRITASTATTVTIDRLHDFHGNTILPPTLAAATRYEVLRNRPNYGIYAEPGLRNFGIYDGTLLRGWSDQIGIQGGRRGEIAGMTVRDGQDVGITVSFVGGVMSEDVNVHDCDIEHQGSAGAFIAGKRHRLHDSRIIDSAWQVSPATAAVLGDVEVSNGEGITVQDMELHRLGEGQAQYGVNAHGEGGGTNVGTTLRGNRGSGHLGAQYRIEGGASTSGTKMRDNDGSVSIAAGTGAVDFGLQEGNGSPEGVVMGSVGDVYRRKDGTAGTTLYLKETGNNTNTGWVALNTPTIRHGKVTADFRVTDATLTDVPGAAVAIGANEVLAFEAFVMYDATIGNDIRIAFESPSGSLAWAGSGVIATAVTVGTGDLDATAIASSGVGRAYAGGRVAGSATPIRMGAFIRGTVTNGVTAGMFKMRAAKAVNTDTTTPVDDSVVFSVSRIQAIKLT